MAALTTQSQLTATTTAETLASVAAAINQLHANQQVMQHQFAAFATQRNTTYQPLSAMQPPNTQFSIPNLATFNTVGQGGGRCGGHECGGRAKFMNAGGCNAQTPFTNFVGRRHSGLSPIGGGNGHGGGALPFAQQTMTRNPAPMYLKIIKKYSNWNLVFLVDLMSRMGILHQRHAPPLGDVRITRKVSIGIMWGNTSERGTMHVPKQCTRVSCPICDGVGQSR